MTIKPACVRQRLVHIFSQPVFLILCVVSATRLNGQAPIANFTGTPESGCSPLVVNFQDLSSNNPTSWLWNFGNGNTSTLQNPTATYFNPGTYTVSLAATNATGSNTMTRTQYITVYEPPTVNFVGDNLSGCFPLRVQFTDLSTAGNGNSNVSWLWDFGDGTTSTQQNPLITYTSAGNYSVTLRVTNDKGCIRTFTRPNYISVSNGVSAQFTNTLPTVCNSPANISFTNNTTGPATLSYQWNFGDGSPVSTVQNPTHTYTSNGTYIVTLVAISTAGCQDTAFSNPIVIGGYNTSFVGPTSVCINEQVTFNNTSTPAPLSVSWDLGDGNTATTINVTHTYLSTGTYTVWLHNDFGGCQDSISQVITVNPRPTADFTAPDTAICQPPFTVNFQDLSSPGTTAWEWDFGDGSPVSTIQNPSHTYNSYGAFTVTLITTNNFGCTDTIIKPGYIIVQRASISFAGLPVRGCVPFTIAPTATINAVDAVTSYQWDFGDGSPTSNLPNPVHTYPVQGIYTVQLIITTSDGCTDTLTMPGAVTVGTKPIADFSASPTNICANESVQFNELSAPADEWHWEFGDGVTSTLQNPVHNYSDTGYFTVTLIAYNNGCPDTMIRTNYIYVLPPIAIYSYNNDCSNRASFTFIDQSIAPLTWEWDFDDGSPTSNVQNPVHIFPGLGNYNVRLVVTNGSCSDTSIQLVRVIDEAPDFSANILVACKTADISFQALNINPANISAYTWDFGDGGTASGNNPTHTYINSGTYAVSLVTLDINNCTDTIIKSNYIRINGPLANFSASNVSGCRGLTVTFNDLSTSDGQNNITNWEWNFGDGTIQNFSAPPFQHTYVNPGLYSVKLVITDAAGCQDSIQQNNIIRTTNPTANFIASDTLTCPGGTIDFTNTSVANSFTSQWYFGDGGTSTQTSPSYIYANAGIYDVKLVISDIVNCPDSIIKTAHIRVENPLAGFTVNDSLSSCLPFEVQFTNTSQFYSTSAWDFGPGEGNSIINNPVHYYATPGTYLVKLVVTNPGGCMDSTFKTITVTDTVGSRLNYLPVNGCKPLTVNFNSFTPGQMASYFWDFGDGTTMTSTTPDVSHIYTSFGSFYPSVIMEDPTGCIIPLVGIDTVIVHGADANFGADTTFFCDFGTVNFSDSTIVNDPIAQYSWTFGDGGVSTQQNPSHQYTSPGLYSVQLIVQTQLGCRDTLTKPTYIKVVQRPLIDIAGDSIICINNSIQHTGIFIQPDTSVVTWQWNFPNGSTSTQQNPPLQNYNTAGIFQIIATATNSSGCVNSTIQVIEVNPQPTVNMPGQITTQNGFPVVIPATYSANTSNWIWSPSNWLSCADCPNPEAEPHFNTTYQVYFTDDNGCSNIGEIDIIVICKNANLFVPNTFSPNNDGNNDVFYPRGRGLERVKFMRIFNRWGEVVFEKRDFPVNEAAFGWNGSFKGQIPKADVYIYQIEVFCENGETIKLNGNIALIL